MPSRYPDGPADPSRIPSISRLVLACTFDGLISNGASIRRLLVRRLESTGRGKPAAPRGEAEADLGESRGDGLETGPVVLGLNVVVHHDDHTRSALTLRHNRRGVVDVGDRDRIDAGFDGGAGEPVVGEHQIRPDLLKDAFHGPRGVCVQGGSSIGQHRHAVEITDLPVAAILPPVDARERPQELRAVLLQRTFRRSWEVTGPATLPARRASASSWREYSARPHGLVRSAASNISFQAGWCIRLRILTILGRCRPRTIAR